MQISLKHLTSPLTIIALITSATLATASNGTHAVMFTGQPVPGRPELIYDRSLDQFVLNDRGQVAFLAVTQGNGQGIWLYHPSQTTLVARTGEAAPGTLLNFGDLRGDLALNNLGCVAFSESVRSGIWSNESGTLELVASRGYPLQGTNYSIWSTRQLSLADNGKIAFFADTIGGPGSTMTVWTGDSRGIQLLAQSENGISSPPQPQAPGVPPGNAFYYRTGFNISHNDAGDVVLGARLIGPEITAATGVGFWTNRTGALSLLSRGGDPAPSSLSGATILLPFGSLSDRVALAMNNHGQVAFPVGLSGPTVDRTNDAAILFEDHGVTSLLARKGDPAPGASAGTTFASFASLIDLNDVGQIAFRGTLVGDGVTPANAQGLWAGTPDNLQLIARLGDAAPGVSDGATFSSFTPGEGSSQKFFTFNDRGQIAFQARLAGPGIAAGNDVGIWATDLNGTLRLIAREGEAIEVATGDSRIVTELFVQMQGVTGVNPSLALNNRGQIAFQASFQSGEGIFLSDAVAIPEPALGAVLPLAILSFYAVQRKRRC